MAVYPPRQLPAGPKLGSTGDRPASRAGVANRTRAWATAHRLDLAAAALIVTGLLYRVYLLVNDVPPTNSDEATMGLAALHIAQGRDQPAFFYGQAYLGAVDSYLAAPLMWILGPSVTVLRLPLLLLYAAFAGGVYVLTRMLYTPGLALFTLGVVVLGSDRTIKDQMIPGGYPEITAGGVWLVALSFALVTGRARQRPAVLAGWGLLAGVLFWDDWLILPYVAAAGAILFAGSWPEPPRWRAMAAAAGAGFAVGAAPLIVFNLTHPLAKNSLSVFLRLSGSSGTAGAGQHLYGGLLFGIPMGTGVCSLNRCAPWQMWWAVAYLGLLPIAATLAVRRLRRARDPEGRNREIARLALLGAAALSVVSYARSGAAATTPIESARYLTPVVISLPAVLWPLWAAGREWAVGSGPKVVVTPAARVLRRALGASAVAVLAGFLAATAAATAALINAVPQHREMAAQRRQFVAVLRQQGIRDMYSDYWTCAVVTFTTREQTVCAVLTRRLRPGQDRYRGYRTQVANSDAPAYVVTDGPGVAPPIAGCLRATGMAYRMIRSGGHRIYQPVGPVHRSGPPGRPGSPCAPR